MESRHEQLRAAKRRQRHRDRAAGQALYQLKLPAELRDRLKAGMRSAAFVARLHAFLRHEYLTREEAFRLYERNWRLVEPARLDAREKALIDALAAEFGQGVINA